MSSVSVCRPMRVRITDCRLVIDLAARNAVWAAALKMVAAAQLPARYRPLGQALGGARDSVRSMASTLGADSSQGARRCWACVRARQREGPAAVYASTWGAGAPC